MELFNVCWKNYEDNDIYIIGWLIYDDFWFFKYNDKTIKKAIKKGFRPFPDMPDISKHYVDNELFSTFRTRYMTDNIEEMKHNQGKLLTDKILIKHIKQ